MASELATAGGGYTPEQVDLIKRTICAGATNDELALFIQQCQRTGLDPFSRQIHAVKRGGRMTIQVGIDGFRLVANRTGETDGQDGPYWCGEDGIWRDVWLGKDKPAACKVTVFRKGQSRGYTGVARWAEFYQPQGGMWDKLPATMLAKVAESIALRKGFPQELSGLYAPEELDQAADVPAAKQLPAPPAASPAVQGIIESIADALSEPELENIAQQIGAAGDAITDTDKTALRAAYQAKRQHLRSINK